MVKFYIKLKSSQIVTATVTITRGTDTIFSSDNKDVRVVVVSKNDMVTMIIEIMSRLLSHPDNEKAEVEDVFI